MKNARTANRRWDCERNDNGFPFAIHLAQLAAHYKLDIEDDLATIIPAVDDDTTDDDHWWHRHRGD